MTNEELADHLSVSVRAVAYWRPQPGRVPCQNTQQIMDAALATRPGAGAAATARSHKPAVDELHCCDKPVDVCGPPADQRRRVGSNSQPLRGRLRLQATAQLRVQCTVRVPA